MPPHDIPHVELNEDPITKLFDTSSPRTALLSDRSIIHAIAKSHGSSSSRRRNDITLLTQLLSQEEQVATKLRAALQRAIDSLNSETKRANEAERQLLELRENFARSEAARQQAEIAAVHAKNEAKRYQSQLDMAQKELERAQEELVALEDERVDAEDAAARARNTARKLIEEMKTRDALRRGRAEGHREGRREGLAIGRNQGFITGRNDNHLDEKDRGLRAVDNLIAREWGPESQAPRRFKSRSVPAIESALENPTPRRYRFPSTDAEPPPRQHLPSRTTSSSDDSPPDTRPIGRNPSLRLPVAEPLPIPSPAPARAPIIVPASAQPHRHGHDSPIESEQVVPAQRPKPVRKGSFAAATARLAAMRDRLRGKRTKSQAPAPDTLGIPSIAVSPPDQNYAPPSPRFPANDVLPEGYIPTLENGSEIQLPPPHAIAQPPPVSPQPTPRVLPQAPPTEDVLNKERQAEQEQAREKASRGYRAPSTSSTSLSDFSLLREPASANRPAKKVSEDGHLSAITEANSNFGGSPALAQSSPAIVVGNGHLHSHREDDVLSNRSSKRGGPKRPKEIRMPDPLAGSSESPPLMFPGRERVADWVSSSATTPKSEAFQPQSSSPAPRPSSVASGGTARTFRSFLIPKHKRMTSMPDASQSSIPLGALPTIRQRQTPSRPAKDLPVIPLDTPPTSTTPTLPPPGATPFLLPTVPPKSPNLNAQTLGSNGGFVRPMHQSESRLSVASASSHGSHRSARFRNDEYVDPAFMAAAPDPTFKPNLVPPRSRANSVSSRLGGSPGARRAASVHSVSDEDNSPSRRRRR